jgi:hypothetical protein
MSRFDPSGAVRAWLGGYGAGTSSASVGLNAQADRERMRLSNAELAARLEENEVDNERQNQYLQLAQEQFGLAKSREQRLMEDLERARQQEEQETAGRGRQHLGAARPDPVGGRAVPVRPAGRRCDGPVPGLRPDRRGT